MQVTIDIPQESAKALRALCDLHGIEIYSFDEHGPAGGNPRYVLAVHTPSALAALGQFYWGN